LEGINAHRRILVHDIGLRGLPADSIAEIAMYKNEIEGVEQRIRDEP
jgi:hypothetical protein